MSFQGKSIAVVADIHGNTAALEAVLDDIRSRGIDVVLNLGDSLYGPLDPAGTFDLIERSGFISISGNEDRMIIENDAGNGNNPTLRLVREQIGSDVLEWLENLPFDLVYDETFYCCHGTPRSDTEYLVEDLRREGVVDFKIGSDIDRILEKIEEKCVLCAHSHVPRVMRTAEHMVINPGSVGLQAYDDDHPVPHKIENHDPSARYSVLSFTGDTPDRIEQVILRYDHDWAARKALKNDRPDWARWLRTGKSR